MTPQANSLASAASHQLRIQIEDSEQPARSDAAATSQRPRADVLGIGVDAFNMRMALASIQNALVARHKGYVCMTGVHGIMEAQRHPAVRDAFANAFLALPDGMPTVWVGRSQGYSWMQRVTGPDLMLNVFGCRELSGFTHFLYGGKDGVAQQLSDNLTRRFPWVRVVGTYTPPFRELTLAEEQQFAARISRLKPSMIWVGISSPRQEIFMRRYIHLLDTTLMFGVGAAFDFHTGRIKDCADWVKRAGLQWLHRLMQDPRRLFWRYMRNNPAFAWRIALQMAGQRLPGTACSKESLCHKPAWQCDSSSDS
jgi:N-acetylglucosaminyldiphosphoundecaprenol N-acetyl-beta-D-mannosaminyltransferase